MTESADAAKARTRKRILSAIDHRWWMPYEIARKSGIHNSTAGKHLASLAQEGRLEKDYVPGCYGNVCYRLKQETTP